MTKENLENKITSGNAALYGLVTMGLTTVGYFYDQKVSEAVIGLTLGLTISAIDYYRNFYQK